MRVMTFGQCVAVTAAVTTAVIVVMAGSDAAVLYLRPEGTLHAGAAVEVHVAAQSIGSIALHGITLSFFIAPVTLFGLLMMRRATLLNRELQRLVDRDRLTDAATRDFFFSKMDKNPTAYGVSLMVDIDHFKLVNDTHGHLVGDQVITHVANNLRACVRSNDIVARFGGEEFVIFLFDHDSDGGFRVAERMRKRVEKEVCQIDGLNLPVTVSIGGSLKEAIGDIER